MNFTNPIILRSKTGSILFLTAALAVTLLGITTLVVDVGYLYYNEGRLQTAVNAGWKAGFDKMMGLKAGGAVLTDVKENLVREHILEVIKTNGYSDAELANVEITFADNNCLQVKAQQRIGLFFAKVMNIDSANIAASRINQENGTGIIPLAIPHGVTKDISKNMYTCSLFTGESGFIPGNEYILKLGSGDRHSSNSVNLSENASQTASISANISENPQISSNTSDTGKQKNQYGPVDPDNSVASGPDDFSERLRYGFNLPIEVNDRLISESGNMTMPTINEYATNSIAIFPITDIGPEVAINNPVNASAKTIYDLQGTDRPDGAYRPDKYPFGSSVRVIGFAEFEILSPASFTRTGDNFLPGDAGSLGLYQTGQMRGKFIGYLVKPGEVPVY